MLRCISWARVLARKRVKIMHWIAKGNHFSAVARDVQIRAPGHGQSEEEGWWLVVRGLVVGGGVALLNPLVFYRNTR